MHPYTDRLMSGLTKWDFRFLEIANSVATWSKDPNTQVGAVLVKDRRILSTGYNGIPKGLEDREDRLQKPIKYQYIEHAERNALCNVNAQDATLYINLFPCNDCTKGIIQAGVSRIVVDPNAEPRQGDDISKEMLKEADVLVFYRNEIY